MAVLIRVFVNIYHGITVTPWDAVVESVSPGIITVIPQNCPNLGYGTAWTFSRNTGEPLNAPDNCHLSFEDLVRIEELSRYSFEDVRFIRRSEDVRSEQQGG